MKLNQSEYCLGERSLLGLTDSMQVDLNRILKLQIRGKLAIAFVGLSIIPVLVVGILGISSNVRSMRQTAFEALSHDLLTIKERVGSFFQGVEENLQFLGASPSFRSFIASLSEDERLHPSESTSEVISELIAYAERTGIFYQIKFIDKDGDEVFGIDRREGRYRSVTEDELSRSRNRFYLYLVGEIPSNEATFIPVELKRDRSDDLLPAISCVYPVYQPELAGILVFQIYAQSFFKIVEQEIPHGPSGTVMLVNAEGYYLYHSDKKKDWNRLLASKETDNLAADYGGSIAETVLSTATTSFYETDGEIVAHAPLFAGVPVLGSQYTILRSVPKSEFFGSATSFKRLFLALLGLFLLGAFVLSYIATRQFTGPVQKLRREAEVIAKGDYRSRVDIRTYDEIEDLSRQFNLMAKSLEQREEEIARHQEKLEQMVKLRTKELESEKDKLQAILDNVPSGFMLLDKEYRIRSVSAAVKSITGKSAETLIGLHCYDLLGDGTKCSDCPTIRVFRSGKMETQLAQHEGFGNQQQYLEHISIPLKKNGEVGSVLEIITDVTERKRLQDQLIRSEKLATTGEIAAVIAHEMRNSITSVRMILQLFSENGGIIDTDRESLDVALDSLGRMEKVVSDLLKLSRPTQLNKRPVQFNTILHEAIEFAEHQIVRGGIEFEIDLATHLPELRVDRDHMKEAIVNLILNASQAIEDEGKISISSRLERLNSEVRDFGEVGVKGSETVTVGVQEVVLKKGTEVLRVDVTDTGGGIPPEHVHRIFDPFFTTKLNGTGLGLSMTKRVVSEHGGIVFAENKKGAGAHISLILPIPSEALRHA